MQNKTQKRDIEGQIWYYSEEFLIKCVSGIVYTKDLKLQDGIIFCGIYDSVLLGHIIIKR